MKYPDWLAAELDKTAASHAARDITRAEAVTAIRNVIMARADRVFMLSLASEFAGRALNSWHQERRATGTTVPEAQCEMFPDLPARLYIRPAVTKPVALLTGHDWDMARNMLQTRTKWAIRAAEADRDAFDAAYAKVRPLLTDDDLTTADVLGGIEAGGETASS